MIKIQISIILISLFSFGRVSGRPDSNRPGINDKPLWITYGRDLPANDSLFYRDQPAPLFRRDSLLTTEMQTQINPYPWMKIELTLLKK
jgi:hypothetical protein